MKWIITRHRATGEQSVCANILSHPHKEWEHYYVEADTKDAAFHAASVLREKQRRLSEKPTTLVMGLLSDARRTGKLKWSSIVSVKPAAERLHMLGLAMFDQNKTSIQLQPMAWNLINDFKGLPRSLTRCIAQDVFVNGDQIGVPHSSTNLSAISKKVEKRFAQRFADSAHTTVANRRELAKVALASKANRLSAMEWKAS